MKKIIITILSILMLFSLVSCSNAQTQTIALSDSALTIVNGTTGTITLDTDSTEGITWKSSNVSIVEVKANKDDNRYASIKANGVGVATIEVMQNGEVVKCTVKVENITLSRDGGNKMTLNLVDGYAQANLEMKTNLHDGNDLYYYCANDNIVKVFANGKVVAISKGKTSITVRHPGGAEYVVYVEVTEKEVA